MTAESGQRRGSRPWRPSALVVWALAVMLLLLGLPAVAAAVAVAPPSANPYVALAPSRILDTRTGLGGVRRPLGPGETRDALVLGVGGVPATDVAAVVLNLTAAGATADTFVTQWPTGQLRPNASVLNPRPGGAHPNLVVAQVGQGGRISLYNHAGTVDLLADVVGYHTAPSSYTSLVPARVLDTRTGVGGVRRPLGPGETREAVVLGVGGVPATGVAAVVLNLTAVGATTDTFVTGWPTGLLRPTASALNPRPGGAFPNLVVAQVGQGGRVSLFNEAGTVDLLADVVGYHTDPSSYTSLVPSRVLDTRSGLGSVRRTLGTAELRDVLVVGVGGVPATGVAAVVLNITAVNATTDTFVTEWPGGTLRPNASALNPRPGGAYPNLVVAQVGQGGRISLYNEAGDVDVLADVVGYYPADLMAGPSAPAWVRQLDTGRGEAATDAAVDGVGGVVVTGVTMGTLPGSAEPNGGRGDAFVASYGPHGEVRWVHQLGGAGYEGGRGVAVDAAGGITIAGQTEEGQLPGSPESNQGASDAFVARYDRSGNLLWVHGLGSTELDMATGVAVDGLGNAFVVGDTRGTLPASSGVSGWANVFLAKYSPAGELLWVRQVGTDAGEQASGVAVDHSGDIIITGFSERTLPGSVEANRGGSDVFVAKFDTSGQQLWARQLGSDQNDSPGGITTDPSGDILVVGRTAGLMDGAPEGRAGSYDGFVARLDPAGNRRWIHQFGADPWDVASDVAVGPSGEVYVTGSMDGVPEVWEVFPASYNTFLAAYSAGGDLRWRTSLGTNRLDMTQAVAVDPLSRVFVVGSTGGTLPGSPDLNTSSSGNGLPLLDGFVAMYRTRPAAG